MRKNKNAESLIGIIIGVVILSVVLIGIINLFNFNNTIFDEHLDNINKYIIESNAEYILKKIDISNLTYNQDFYLYKDETNKEFKVLTGTLNEDYSYINNLGENVDKTVNIGKTFKRVFSKKIDILKNIIEPSNIPDLVIHFDSTNIDGSNNSTINQGDPISNWVNLANNLDAYQNDANLRPKYKKDIIGNLGLVLFDGVDDLMILDNNELFNNDCECGVDSNCYADKVYPEKSFALAFKTGFDILNKQVVYEQGGAATGYNFMINNGDLYAGIHNKADSTYACTEFSSSDSSFHFEWDSGHQFKSINLGEILPDTIYFIMIVQDSTHTSDTDNRLQIFLNGILVDETDHVDPQPEHWKIGFGNINERNVEPWSPFDTIDQFANLPFSGYIGEFISWNYALSKLEVTGIQNYFMQKWLGGDKNVIYDSVATSVKKYNNN